MKQLIRPRQKRLRRSQDKEKRVQHLYQLSERPNRTVWGPSSATLSLVKIAKITVYGSGDHSRAYQGSEDLARMFFFDRDLSCVLKVDAKMAPFLFYLLEKVFS